MKFVFQYRTSDNAVHNGVVEASDREAAFRKLRQQGVKPFRLEEASGVFNKLWGRGKRWLVICFLIVLLVVAFVLLRGAKKEIDEVRSKEVIKSNAITEMSQSAPRHQIYGDPAIVAKLKTCQGLLDVLGEDAACYIDLAAHAQPGCVVDTKVFRYSKLSSEELLSQALTKPLNVSDVDAREIVELKQIVNGMREEFADYVRDSGVPVLEAAKKYLRRLKARSNEERRILEFTRRSLLKERNMEIWDEKNDGLRKLGLPTIPAPYE